MKKYIHIILAIIILILGVVIAYLYFGKFQNNEKISEPSETVEMPTSAPTVEPTTEPMDESTPEDMDTLTNADRGAASGEVVVAIDFKDIDPAVHSTYNAETGEITVDDTMVNTLMEKSAYFDNRSVDNMRAILPIYLEGYFTGRYDGEAWYQFVLTGDTSYLNFEISGEELIIQTQQAIDAYLNSDEFKNSSEYEEYMQAQDEIDRIKNDDDSWYAFLAEELGITPEEAKEMFGGNSGNSSNGGGGSSPVANPSTQQPNADENNFVTPENPTGGNGSGNSDPWQGDGSFEFDEDPGDGGDLVTDGHLNP